MSASHHPPRNWKTHISGRILNINRHRCGKRVHHHTHFPRSSVSPPQSCETHSCANVFNPLNKPSIEQAPSTALLPSAGTSNQYPSSCAPIGPLASTAVSRARGPPSGRNTGPGSTLACGSAGWPSAPREVTCEELHARALDGRVELCGRIGKRERYDEGCGQRNRWKEGASCLARHRGRLGGT